MHGNEIGTIIVETAIEIHRKLGPGLLEFVYEVILAHKLKQRGLNVERQVGIAIEFEGIQFEEGFRADMIVEAKVIVDLKSKREISRSDRKQDTNLFATHRAQTGLFA